VESKIVKVERRLGHSMPAALRWLYSEGDGRFNKSGQWWVIWPLARLASENAGAWRRGLPEEFLAFGDDGAGNAFCMRHDGASQDVLRWNWIDLALEGSEGPLPEFLAKWVESPS
jgi:hypothetical protein